MRKGKVKVEWITINHISVPICSIFCAFSAILTLVVITKNGHQSQELHHPLAALLAQWSAKLSYSAPSMVSVVFWTTVGTPEATGKHADLMTAYVKTLLMG